MIIATFITSKYLVFVKDWRVVPINPGANLETNIFSGARIFKESGEREEVDGIGTHY